ncbi:unnamed protein product [Clonostachys byssicola]|uniref:Uncharacterized protein n=1 Tax=Clonostachys byssicola TaxID=160290 RepID=A0A9N9UQR3_9HYPO|nr:unnamed protein product [Clonostachys byssicola]
MAASRKPVHSPANLTTQSTDSLLQSDHSLIIGAFGVKHMKLLHHFTIFTASTLSNNSKVQEVWRMTVPRLSFSTHFVLYAILALASLHLAYLEEDQAQHHWSRGIELFQKALDGAKPAMQHITEDNCTSLYLFSMLTCYFVLARGYEYIPGVDEGEGGVLGWIFLFQGTKTLLTAPYPTILRSGPLGVMFEVGEQRALLLDSTRRIECEALGMLREALQREVSDVQEMEVYAEAVRHLQLSYNIVYEQPRGLYEGTDVFIWLFRTPPEYFNLLKRRRPASLAIFLCFAALIRQLHDTWWARDWGEGIIKIRGRATDGFWKSCRASIHSMAEKANSYVDF